MRPEVADSWQRSAAAGVDAGADEPPITLDEEALAASRADHPLAAVYPLLDEVLGEPARRSDALLALTDDQGQILWLSGTTATRRRAERIGFVEGSNWDEQYAGTNAPGTSLTLDRPTMILGAEHYRESVKPWNCAAAPIHDPTGRILGVLDITGGADVAVPMTLAMVHTAARLAEAELASAYRPTPAHGPNAAGRLATAPFTLETLGRREATLAHRGRRQVLSRRHSEVVALLAAHPEGLTGDELGLMLYEGGSTVSTLRAELNRLRGLLGEEILGSRPYRLLVDVAADWHLVAASIAADDLVTAVRRYAGPLLPWSDAPGIRDLRDELHADVRQALLASRRADLMAGWTRTPWGSDDYAVWLAQEQLVPSGSALHRVIRAHLARLDAELA
ncbi:Transcriptional regulator [Nostocoides japonicum T1-X7]|uniref:Transcriptional regulator n=2 Tax=Nostocoides japonicum TaxID=99481 RepID=A0A077M8J2_9MICO|nr:Transcriptional regulator [Tetrasphaera japonica T1-X7]